MDKRKMGKASNKVFREVSCFSLHTGKNKDHVRERQTEGRPRGQAWVVVRQACKRLVLLTVQGFIIT